MDVSFCYLMSRFTLINIAVQKMYCMLSISFWNDHWFCFLLFSLYNIAKFKFWCIFDVIWCCLICSATSGYEKKNFFGPAMIFRYLVCFDVIFFNNSYHHNLKKIMWCPWHGVTAPYHGYHIIGWFFNIIVIIAVQLTKILTHNY